MTATSEKFSIAFACFVLYHTQQNLILPALSVNLDNISYNFKQFSVEAELNSVPENDETSFSVQ